MATQNMQICSAALAFGETMLLTVPIAPVATFIAHTETSISAELAVFVSLCSHVDWVRIV
jgi:hypothetical protein